MTRISVSLDDPVAEALKSAAGGEGKVSGWVARLVREKLLTDAAAAAGAFDRQAAAGGDGAGDGTGDDAADAAWEAERLTGRA